MAEIHIRREIGSLSETELEKLREAFIKLREKTGPDGYQSLAAIHTNVCQHNHPHFLAWHREYIFRLERSLREIDPQVQLPFWDWGLSSIGTNGIPNRYAEHQYQLTNGQSKDNPLYSAEIEGRMTRRVKRSPLELKLLPGQVRDALRATTFKEFHDLISGPHQTIHTWVSGDMRTMKAAFDPIFWAHHANVDRYWAFWQRKLNGPDPPEVESPLELNAFEKAIGQTLHHVNEYGYDYDYAGVPEINMVESVPAANLMNGALALADLGGSPAMGPLTQSSGLINPAAPAKPRVRLRIRGLRMDKGSYHVNVFINQPDANHETPREDNPHYAGAFGIFGAHSEAMNQDHQHSTHHHSPSHHMHPIESGIQILDISDNVAQVAAGGDPIEIKLVAEKDDGTPIEASQLPIADYSVEIEMNCHL